MISDNMFCTLAILMCIHGLDHFYSIRMAYYVGPFFLITSVFSDDSSQILERSELLVVGV